VTPESYPHLLPQSGVLLRIGADRVKGRPPWIWGTVNPLTVLRRHKIGGDTCDTKAEREGWGHKPGDA
jgi:hypothetical protein